MFSKKVGKLIIEARICLESSDYIEDAHGKAEALSKAAVVLSTKDNPDYDDALLYDSDRKRKK